MAFPNSLLRLLSRSQRMAPLPREAKLQRARNALLALVEPHSTDSFRRVAQRLRYAADMESLWYLRQDVLCALSEVGGEAQARQQVRQVNALFEGALPAAMVARRAHRFHG